MEVKFLTKYPEGFYSAWAVDPSGRMFNFLCSLDGTRVRVRAIRRRLENGKWHTVHAKQAVRLAVEIERAVARKMAGGAS